VKRLIERVFGSEEIFGESRVFDQRPHVAARAERFLVVRFNPDGLDRRKGFPSTHGFESVLDHFER
jgi:hypothetical protein